MKAMRFFLLLAASFSSLFSSGQLAAQTSPSVTLVKAGRLLDPRAGNVLSPAAVLIEGGKIKEVGFLLRCRLTRQPASKQLIWLKQEFLLIDSPDGARQAVRQNVFYSVDVIKVTIGNNISSAEMTAIVEEAHRQGLKVAAHAVDTGSIQTAIDGGADSI